MGVRYKLATYSLALDHADGGPKARGFALILGISLASIDYLEAVIKAEILKTPIAATRTNPPHGVNGVVEFPIKGIGERTGTVVTLRTVWLVSEVGAAPRLLSALLKP